MRFPRRKAHSGSPFKEDVMKHFTLFAVLLSSSAFAQTALTSEMSVNVPFAFVVAGEPLPAGHYVVRELGNACIRIFNSKTEGVVVQTHAALRNASEGSQLVFHCYEGACFLASVWTTGELRGVELFPTRTERELAKRNAQMNLAVLHPLH
jgi:hypothetical protein